MTLGSIVFALRHHKSIVALIVLGTAMTFVVTCNAGSIIAAKWRVLTQESGIEEDRIVVLQATSLEGDANHAARQQEMLATLQATGSIDAAATLGVMTFLNDLTLVLHADTGTHATAVGTSLYFGSPQSLDALGVRLMEGTGFDSTDFVRFEGGAGLSKVGSIVLSRDSARRLFGNASPIGRVVRLGSDRVATVKGVTGRLLRPHPSNSEAKDNYLTAIVPLVPDGSSVTYALHVAPGVPPGNALEEARRTFLRSGGNVILEHAVTFPALRAAFFQHERTRLQVLLVGTGILLAVTLMGLAGLVHYWVRLRIRAIGIRRAIGATRMDILCELMLENALVTGVGMAIGAVLAFALGHVLSSIYEVPPLSLSAVAIAASTMSMLGWIATLKPAWWASRMPPRIAMDE